MFPLSKTLLIPIPTKNLLHCSKSRNPTITHSLYSHLHNLLVSETAHDLPPIFPEMAGIAFNLRFPRRRKKSPSVKKRSRHVLSPTSTSSSSEVKHSRGRSGNRSVMVIRATGQDGVEKDGGAIVAFPCFEKSRWQREFPMFTTRLPVPVLPPLPDFLSSLRRPFTCRFRENVCGSNVRSCSFTEWKVDGGYREGDTKSEKVCGGLTRLAFFEKLNFLDGRNSI